METTLTGPTKFVVRVSCAKMPNNSRGRYQHVAVLEVVEGHVPTMIRDTAKQRIVRAWRGCNVGRTGRCAAARAIAAANELAIALNAAAQAARTTP